MVTTFVCLASCHTHQVWHFLERASQIKLDVRLAEMEHPCLKIMSAFCSSRVLIYVHPSLYRALKLKFLLDVGGLCRDGQVMIEFGIGSLKRVLDILTPKDFEAIDSE